jgi:hypothetical protein
MCVIVQIGILHRVCVRSQTGPLRTLFPPRVGPLSITLLNLLVKIVGHSPIGSSASSPQSKLKDSL